MSEITNQTTNTLWLPDGAVKADERDSSDRLKIAIVGPLKGGKSRLAATSLRKPIYFWDFDDRFISVSGMPGVIGKTYTDTTNLKESSAWPQVQQDMNMFEYQKAKGNQIPATMVFDSLTTMIDRVQRWILVSSPDLRREIIINKSEGIKTFTPYGYDYYKTESDQIKNVINRAVELGCDVVIISHERAEETADSTEKVPKYTGKITVHPPRAKEYLIQFNELWRMRPNDQGVYKVQVRPNYEFVGATCLNLDTEEEPNIEKMIEKHKKGGK